MTKTQIGCAVVAVAVGIVAAYAAYAAVCAAIVGWAGVMLAILAANFAFNAAAGVSFLATWGLTKAIDWSAGRISVAVEQRASRELAQNAHDAMADAHYATVH